MAQGRFYKDLHQELVVQQILPTIYDGDDFPGYDKVKLSYQQHTSTLMEKAFCMCPFY